MACLRHRSSKGHHVSVKALPAVQYPSLILRVSHFVFGVVNGKIINWKCSQKKPVSHDRLYWLYNKSSQDLKDLKFAFAEILYVFIVVLFAY